ncbi:MAG TPA: HAMP domain-containing sensor histidine kinase [Chryseosolibacter sp.]|nr:HAMP domain-containing sensor histidine kinase [Chryseosolibacter sp.]
MKNKHLRGLILLGTFVLTGLFLVQAYWFRKAFDVEEKQFDHSVQVALRKVADSVSAQAEVRKLSSNFFFVATESVLDNESIDGLLKIELLKRDLELDYELGIYNADDDTLVYGQYVEATKKHFIEKEFGDVHSSAREKNFAVYFPRKETYVIGQLDVWIFSTVVLLSMMFFFAYALVTLLRERKFSELKNDFINNMTHEFRTPVTNIGITGEIIRKKVPEEAGVNVYVDILLKENDKLRSKIDQILLASSVDHRKKPWMERIDVHQLISECADTFQLKVQERKGRIRLEFNAKSTFILGDRDLLTQAINNVIDNAEKYSPDHPRISVKTLDHKDGIEIDIVDEGIGIPQAMHKRVFDKFFRVQRGNIHNVKGFGLGLNFVKGVIRSHRGEVRLFSELNKGTEVRIFLPKA